MWCGGPSRRRLPSSIPAGYVSQTGYQYDSISRVAGQREPAPPSNFSKLGGFKNNVFIADDMNSPPQELRTATPHACEHLFYSICEPSKQAFGWMVHCNTFANCPVACRTFN